MSLRLFAFTFLSLAAVACDPVMVIGGEVKTVPHPTSEAEVYDSEKPIAGAKVVLVCNGVTRPLGTTDANGHFSFATAGWLDTVCVVEVRADGYYPERLAANELCVGRENKDCHFMRVFAELVPQPAAKP